MIKVEILDTGLIGTPDNPKITIVDMPAVPRVGDAICTVDRVVQVRNVIWCLGDRKRDVQIRIW